MAALVKAIEEKRFKQAELLLKLGDNVNQQEKHSGTTPLLAICFLEDENLACRIAKKLLHRGADICLQDEDGMSPLMQACKLGKEKLVHEFIKSDECDFGAADSRGNTALIYSIDAGNARITKALTEAMNVYDVRVADKPNKDGETPLIRATKLKRNDCKEVLLSDGKASPCARDFDLKLNAKEWEFCMNKTKDNESNESMSIEIDSERNEEMRDLNKKQNRSDFQRERVKSSIINDRQDFTNTASSACIVEGHNSDKVLQRRTKSAPILKGYGGHHLILNNSVTCNVKPRNNEIFIHKKTVCFEHESLHVNENSKENGVTMSTDAECCNEYETSSKMNCGRGGLVRKDTVPSSAPVRQKLSKHPTGRNGGEITSFSHQSQLPKLFMLMTQQKSHAFRSSAKERTSPGEKSRSKRQSSSRTESGKRKNSRRGSAAIARQRRRWSSAMTALDTMERFPLLFSRSDFEALNRNNLEMMAAQTSTRTRRSSVQSNHEGLGRKSSQKEKRSPAISPRLLELNPVLSHSLPEKTTLSRVRSAKPGPRFARNNSVPSISSGNMTNTLSEALRKTPVIEEAEEGAAIDC